MELTYYLKIRNGYGLKRFAYKYENGEYDKTNVWELYRGEKQDPHRWEKMRYFSTHKKIENRKEMRPVRRKPNYFFKYKSLNDITAHEGHDTTLTHEIIQEIISELKEITFILKNKGNKVYKIHVSEYEIEEKIKTDKGDYFVDILFKFEKSEPESLVLQWNGIVAVEIHVTNEVEPTKIKDLIGVGIPILEHTVSKKFYVDESRELTEADISKTKQFLKRYYEKEIYVALLDDYHSKEFINMMEIQTLKDKIESLEKHTEIQKNELKQYMAYTNKLKMENASLKDQINEKDNEISLIKNENEQLKKSIWYKVSRIVTGKR